MNNIIKALFIIIFLLPIVSLATPGLPVTHDGQDHVARIANFFESISEGNLVPRWGSNLNWGYGHPVLMFLYPLSSYLASLFHAVGFTLIGSVKLVFASTYLASIFFMYLFIKDKWGTESALVASLLYGFAPYRFVNIYVRGAIGEHTAFVFLPLILLCISKIAKNSNRTIWGLCLSLSIAGLLLAHNAVSLMMLPIIFLYITYLLVYEVKNKTFFLIRMLLFSIYGVGLAAFFIVPAFFEGKYTLRDIVTSGLITDRFVLFKSFLYSPWNYGGGNEFTKEIGLPLLLVLTSIWFLLKKKTEHKTKVLLFSTIILFLGYLVAMTSIASPIWNSVSILQKFQFPWRLLVMTSFLGSIIGGVFMSLLSDKTKKIFILIFIFLSLFSTRQMWMPKEFKNYNESFFTNIYYSTTDTGESSPIWSTRFMEYVPESPIEVVEGEAKIESIKRTTTERVYQLNVSTKTKLVENTLYFPGWKVFVDGKETPIEFQNQNHRGLILFEINEGSHTVNIVFGDTKLRTVSNIISLTSMILLVPLAYALLKPKKIVKIQKKH